MEIDKDLKLNLIADVENVCCLDLDEETKEALMRCFEVTIGCHNLLGSKPSGIATIGVDKGINEDMSAVIEIMKEKGKVILIAGGPIGSLQRCDIPESLEFKRIEHAPDPIGHEIFSPKVKRTKKERRSNSYGRKPSKF